ncbi:MAG: 2-oxoisovalerate dehydrogenase E1 component, partial [Myxococcota bacterium]
SLAWGQDIAREKGGVFKVTRGLSEKYPKHVMNAPINEPLIMGTAVGAAHHQEMRVFPEIQFGDYSLNTLHWMVHAGNIYWGSGGNVHVNITLRTPVDPVPGGALYHSMAIDGFFTPVQGWVIVCPSTTFDAYGLLRTAGDYQGPVMILEPKVLYRRTLGLRLPGEPPAPALKRARRESGESLLCADDLSSIADYRIPFGKGVVRREGSDVTIVTYGNTVHLADQAATILAREDGIEATIIDLRTLSPWDKDLVLESARATGRLLVAHQASTFAGFGREVQGSVHEEIDGLRSVTIGMRNVPAVASARELEEHTILGPRRIMLAARELCRRPEGAFVANENSWLQFAPTRRTS